MTRFPSILLIAAGLGAGFQVPLVGQTPAGGRGPEPQLLTLPPSTNGGPSRDVHVLADTAALKLVAIELRDGTGLPVHESPHPITIQVLRGEATLLVGSAKFLIGSAQILTLPAKTPHAVELRPGTTATLLIHHLRGGQAAGEAK